MGAVTPGETLGTLYNIHVGSNKTKQHTVTRTHNLKFKLLAQARACLVVLLSALQRATVPPCLVVHFTLSPFSVT